MQVNKVHSVRTLALVAKDLGEDADWLADIALSPLTNAKTTSRQLDMTQIDMDAL